MEGGRGRKDEERIGNEGEEGDEEEKQIKQLKEKMKELKCDWDERKWKNKQKEKYRDK